MDERKWLKTDRRRPMLKTLVGDRFSDRKARLYLCAGLREIWDQLYSPYSQDCVDAVERRLDGRCSTDEFERAVYMAECPTFSSNYEADILLQVHAEKGEYHPDVVRLLERGVYSIEEIQPGADFSDRPLARTLRLAAVIAEQIGLSWGGKGFDEWLMQVLVDQPGWPGAWLIREVFGNPFRPAVIDPDWLAWDGGAVPAIARGIYDQRAYDRMPILGDALEDAGCRDEAVLRHARHEERHIHGCWLLDAILGHRDREAS